jgi:hypothetical protein
MHYSSRGFMTVVAFGFASVVNPGYFAGCASAGGETFEFGEAEMLELMDDANVTGPFDIMSGSQRYRLEVSFEQKSGEDADDIATLRRRPVFTARAHACGTRTFMQSAAACLTTSEVPLTATVNLYRIDSAGETQVVHDEAVDGRFYVWGRKLTNARIESNSSEMGSSRLQLSLVSSDGKTFKLAHFRIVAQDLLVEVDKDGV